MSIIKKMGLRKNRRTFFIIVSILFCLLILRNCAIVGLVGPFAGTVVDANTQKPLEGAGVMIWYHTKTISVGGPVGHTADFFEAITDGNGKFCIPMRIVAPLEPSHMWGGDYFISIFKPGYGTYPGNIDTYCSYKIRRSYRIEKNGQTYYLPELSSLEERSKNYLSIKAPTFDANLKNSHFWKLKSKERVFMGLTP